MIAILDTASYISTKINSNKEMCSHIEGLDEEWVIAKTGIKKRLHISESESASSMAEAVAKRLIKEIDRREVGLIIVASFSQDYMFPPMSVKIHQSIGASNNCQVMDINVNCVGLVTATTIAVERMNANPNIAYALVIGVEVLSKFVDKKDKFTAPFFSDGASGVLLGRRQKKGYIDSRFYTDSSVYEEVRLKRDSFIEHNGKTTWTQAITTLPYILKLLVYNNNLTLNDIDFFIFHQSNKVLIDYIMDKHKIPHSRTYTNVEEIGNTGAASIGIALDKAMKSDLIKDDDLVVLAGIGAGFNFGVSLWRM